MSDFTHDCQYKFVWRTSLVCPKALPGPTSCSIAHNKDKANVELSALYRDGGHRVAHGNAVFLLNVCGTVCNSSGVCTESGVSYGQNTHSVLKWMGNELKLMYFGGDNCLGSISGKRTAAIYFTCDMDAGFGTPEVDPITVDVECMAVFTWKTNLTCVEALYGITKSSTTTTTTTTTSTTTTPTIPTTTSNTNTSDHLQPSAEKSSSGSGSGSGSGAGTAVTVLVVLMVLTLVAVGVVGWRAGYITRLINRAKMATATRYSSRWSSSDNENTSFISSSQTSRFYNNADGDEEMISVLT